MGGLPFAGYLRQNEPTGVTMRYTRVLPSAAVVISSMRADRNQLPPAAWAASNLRSSSSCVRERKRWVAPGTWFSSRAIAAASRVAWIGSPADFQGGPERQSLAV